MMRGGGGGGLGKLVLGGEGGGGGSRLLVGGEGDDGFGCLLGGCVPPCSPSLCRCWASHAFRARSFAASRSGSYFLAAASWRNASSSSSGGGCQMRVPPVLRVLVGATCTVAVLSASRMAVETTSSCNVVGGIDAWRLVSKAGQMVETNTSCAVSGCEQRSAPEGVHLLAATIS